MASAAAVGANAAQSPIHNTIGVEHGYTGEVTEAIVSIAEIESESDAVSKRKQDALEDELFGGEEGEEEEEEEEEEEKVEDELPEDPLEGKGEQHSDEDADKDEQEDGEAGADAQPEEHVEKITMDLKMGRQPLPEPSDGEMYLMKVPAFMSIEPTSWDHRRFQPPVPDQSSKADSLIFSAYNTALSTIRWRRAPSNPSQLQSNARILRWSDGSLTLQLASQPTLQYEISGNALAPPLRNPAKPTPTSVSAPADKSGRAGDGTVPDEKYNESKDAFSYLIVPSEDTATLRVSHKLTAGLTVQQSGGINGVAVKKLQAQISHEAKSSRVKGGTGVGLKLIEEDPERKKQEAEKALKEKQKQERKRENAMMRDQERNSRALGRHGLSSGRGSGLNASFLEDEDGETGYTRSRKPGSARKPRQRHGSIYSDDEDFGRRNYRSREDEYDQEDDFVAPSDEEEEAPADDDDPDDGIEEPSPKRSRSTKDAEDEVEASVAPVRKRQRVIVDDDDE